MSWSTAFFRKLAAREPRIHLIEAYNQDVTLGGDGTAWSISSRLLQSERDLVGLGIDAARPGSSQGGSVAPGSWRSSIGQWQVGLIGDPRPLWRRMWRGQMVVHRIGFAGWSRDRFEVVQIGTLDDITGEAGRFTLVCKDLLSAFVSRYDSNVNDWPLFAGLGNTTTLDESYDVGTETSLDVVDASVLGLDSAGFGAVLIDPEDEEAFFHRYSSKSGNSLVRPAYSVNEDLGTAHQNRNNGKVVQEVALIEGKVGDVVRRILASTGNGSNGDHDTLPETWGFGLPDELIDHADIEWWEDYLAPGTGSQDISLHTLEEKDNGLAWLTEQLAPMGVFLAVHQGQVTVRGAVDPNIVNAAAARSGVPLRGKLRGSMLTGAIQYSAFRGGGSQEHRRIRLWTGAGFGASSFETEAVNSHPAKFTIERDLSKLIFDNEDEWHDSLMARLKPWDLRLAEKMVVRINDPHAMGLAPGDTLELDLPYFTGRHDGDSDTPGMTGRAGMVTKVDPDFWGGSPTKVTLAIPPDRDDRFS